MQIATFDPTTGAFVSIVEQPIDPVRSAQGGSPVLADINPMVATDVMPPEHSDDQCPVFNVASGTWSLVQAPPAPPPTRQDVERERDRRLALGFAYDFGDERGVHEIGTTKADMLGWDEVTKIAQSRFMRGITTPIGINTDTGGAIVTPTEWLAILDAAADFRQPIWQASFVLSAESPIPADYSDDSHWTVIEHQ